MKKILTILVTFMIITSAFASKSIIPTDTILANYYDAGQLCVCVYFEGDVCNDIVFAGTHNGWDISSPTSLPKFEEVEGYPGWWVVAVTDTTTGGDGICGKPVQLTKDGTFDWDYQTGDCFSWTLVRGMVQIYSGFFAESNLKGYSTATPVVLISAYWKNDNTPCGIPTNTITYTAWQKLGTTYGSKLNSAFNVSITDHTFSNGTGVITFDGKVTSIGNDAFENSRLISITLPNSVTSIGESAFSLCDELSSIVIPNKVTSIGDYAFYKCSSLTSVTIGESVTSIGDDAFYHCNSIKSVVWNAKNCALWTDGYGSFLNFGSQVESFVFGDLVEVIPDNICYGMTNLSSVTIGESVTSIGGYAFYNCSNLYNITIPNNVTNIGNSAFHNCKLLPVENNIRYADTYLVGAVDKTKWTYTIREGTKWIGDEAFSDCKYFSSLTIPNSVISISDDAFLNCNLLSSFNVETANTHYSSIDGVLFNYAKDTLIRYPTGNQRTTYTIPDGVTSIGDNAFDNSIHHLSSINIPNSVTSIGFKAFYFSIASITCYAVTPPTCTFNSFAFEGYTRVYVPAESVTAYQSDDVWKKCSKIKPIGCCFVSTSVNNPLYGSISGGGEQYDTCTLTAIANDGYHFTQWNDANTDNPRTLILTQDTTFEAWFNKDTFTITTAVNYPKRGTTVGDTMALYLDSIQIRAIANDGYHFTQWNDGNTENPRTIVVKANAHHIAQFDKNIYIVSLQKDDHVSNVSGSGKYEYLSEITISATIDDYYRFAQWSDGITDNPRTIVVTQDTTFMAQSKKIYEGACGTMLTWVYANGSLTISGVGPMHKYSSTGVPWLLFRDSITNIVIENGVTSIGDYAFYGCANKELKSVSLPNGILTIGNYAFANCGWLKSITFGSDLEEIGNSAFAGDQRLIYVNCYAIEPPLLGTTPFENYDSYLNVLCDYKDEYTVSLGWKMFTNISCIGAEEESATRVVVTPGDNYVTIIWPTDGAAVTYTIEIKKDGIVFCMLTFNAQGQLMNIAFAPSRSAKNSVNAIKVASGYKFTITNLDPDTKYNYEIEIHNVSGASIANYTGTFTTTTNTAIGQIFDSPVDQFTKIIKDGQLLILRDGKMYNAQGMVVE